MKKATRTALEGSIKKWEDVLAGKIKEMGPENCPLCDIFYNRVNCGKCPVKVSTGAPTCENSPYDAWLRYQSSRFLKGNRNAYWATDKRSKNLAKAERDFLISLRVE